MKKVLFITLMIICIFYVQGQDRYKCNITFKFEAGSFGGGSACWISDRWSKIILHYEDGITEKIHDDGSSSLNITFPTRFSSKKITGVQIQGYARRNGGWCPDRDDESVDYTIIPLECSTVSHSDAGDQHAASISYEISVQVLPIHNLTPSTTYLPSDEKITISDNPGFLSSLYKYQYSIDAGVTWNDINPALYYLDKLSLSAKDLFGANYINYVGTNVFFRAVSCWYTNPLSLKSYYRAISNIILLTVIPSAPHITNVKSIPTTCSDINDGKIVLSFDRTLFSGETLQVLLQGHTVDITSQLSSSTQATISNLASGTYTINLFGSYLGNNTYTDAPTHKATVTVGTPTAVVFDTSVTPVHCFEGSDGEIKVTASGGVGNYAYNKNDEGWTGFSGTSTNIKNLAIGSYNIKVQDGNGCVAKVSGVEKVVKVTMTMPAEAVRIVDTSTTEPRGYGLSNGYIIAEVAGGTHNAGRYTYEWYKDAPNGIPITTNIVKQVGTSVTYTEKLDKIVSGTYYLTVKDKNYTTATSNQHNCELKDIEFIVNQPDPLLVNILVNKKISCHVDNEYTYKIDKDVNGIPDEAEDGIFKSMVSGGVGNYRYEWQKQGSSGYQTIAGATTGNLTKITGGNYKLIVTDVNDNQTIADTLSYYPDKLETITTGSMVKCNSHKEGEVSVVTKGGVGNYKYEWNTSDNTPKVTGLGAGTYEVVVTDANKCRVNKRAVVEQPGSLKISDSILVHPKCYQDKNGSIEVMLSGGKTPYEVKWDNLMQGTKIDNIGAGKYFVTITDANVCSITQGYRLHEPKKIVVDLGKDITLCKGDSIRLDAKIDDVNPTYQWIDDTKKQIAYTASIVLKNKGTYSVISQDSKGCKGGDTIQVSLSDAVLNPEFLINTHVYIGASVKMVNTSPKQPQSVSWVVPENKGIKKLNQSEEYIELEFANAGSYKLGLKGMEGLCEKIYYKDIVVEENELGVDVNSTETSNIVEYTVNLNSNKGECIVKVKLNTGASIRIKLMDMEGKISYTPINKSKATNFEVPMNYNLKSGVYILILETGNEVQVRKLVVE